VYGQNNKRRIRTTYRGRSNLYKNPDRRENEVRQLEDGVELNEKYEANRVVMGQVDIAPVIVGVEVIVNKEILEAQDST